MLLNPAEAAAILKVHKRTLLEWIADGKVKATKLSRKTIRISLDDLPLSPDEKALVLGKQTTVLPADSFDKVKATIDAPPEPTEGLVNLAQDILA